MSIPTRIMMPAALALAFAGTAFTVLPADAMTCLRRSFTASCALQVKSPQAIVRNCATKAWEDKVRSSAGDDYANWSNAKGSINCQQDPQSGQFKCTANGIPCKP